MMFEQVTEGKGVNGSSKLRVTISSKCRPGSGPHHKKDVIFLHPNKDLLAISSCLGKDCAGEFAASRFVNKLQQLIAPMTQAGMEFYEPRQPFGSVEKPTNFLKFAIQKAIRDFDTASEKVTGFHGSNLKVLAAFIYGSQVLIAESGIQLLLYRQNRMNSSGQGAVWRPIRDQSSEEVSNSLVRTHVVELLPYDRLAFLTVSSNEDDQNALNRAFSNSTGINTNAASFVVDAIKPNVLNDTSVVVITAEPSTKQLSKGKQKVLGRSYAEPALIF